MKPFPGFPPDETFTQVPETFFRQLLVEIDDLDELKVTLHAIWRIEHMEGQAHVLREKDFGPVVPEPAPALEKAVRRGSLLEVRDRTGRYYFLNTPRGRAAAEALRTGSLSPDSLADSAPLPERPNIYRLYEENIGPLTPLIADALKDAEATYHAEWVEEALEIAVKNNKRSWKYVEAILKRWKEEGRAKRQDRKDSQKGFKRYTEGEFAEYLKRD
jgi:DnaD/phage-associated family protein